ncbi:putative oxidoreductase protein [Bradyrhizobium sp. ORS 285]|uniref:SDR family NAD(P)-dependent oxidoreductase n=1 Tax=Bradyrhizobium sp. ORS 285 TaxID=115808 RepID=UPI000240947A|nr:SDR family oxidoreductase [Bradyrhizobium sp. ORS 285]CCD84605.1 putative oxidoreductase protein [Bradyrhizobium sp. ORS 285]SMX57585.1 putative oxidoreductase protein [Bradyrhizobium sp. ORS 285]
MTSQTKGTVLITGASSGIGAVYAERFAARGHDLILVARNQDRLNAIADKLATRHGVKVKTLVADLTARDDLAKVEAVLTADASITHLVNNAGFGSAAPLASASVDEMEKMVAINVTAPLRLTYAAVPQFVARKQGTIINIASIVAIGPEVLNGVYGGTKSFVLAFSQSLRKELAGTGVHVQVVLPGATGTEFWDIAGLPASNLPKEWVMTPADLVDAALRGLDRGEFATVPSLADGAEFDAWEAARQAMLPHLSSAEVAERYRS